MRKRIFEIIEIAKPDDVRSRVYDIFMIIVILLSIIPLAFKQDNGFFVFIDYFAGAVFIFDYILRYLTADYRLGKGALSFFIYPFTPMAIIDLLCILPSFTRLGPAFRVLKVFRLFVAFRAFKMFRYSRSFRIIINVIKRQKHALAAVFSLALAYIFVAALVIFNVEPDIFDDFLDALYWATISLATIGYGDIVPVTDVGRFVTIVSTLVGMAIIALPSGIITAGYIREIDENHDPDHILDELGDYLNV